MNNLAKELIKQGDRSAERQGDLVNGAKLLLSSTDAEERRLLQNIGLDTEMSFYEQQKIELADRAAKRVRLGRPIVTLEEIERMCLRYRLYMRRAHVYVGKIPTYLGASINSFVKERGIVVGQHRSVSDFYIIAPPDMFADYISPKNAIAGSYKEAYTAFKERQKDPILVLDLKDGTYAVVESWGQDFTFLRRLKAIWHSGPVITLMFYLFMITVVCLFIELLYFQLPKMLGLYPTAWASGANWFLIVQVLLSIVAFLFTFTLVGTVRETEARYKNKMLSKRNWRQGYLLR